VFGDGDARPRRHDRARRRDVDRVVVVAAGATGVDERLPLGLDRACGVAHPLGEAGDLGLGFAFRPERGQQGTDLCLRRFLEDESGDLACLVLCQVLTVSDAFDVLLHGITNELFRVVMYKSVH
jgi:hypothetical protein